MKSKSMITRHRLLPVDECVVSVLNPRTTMMDNESHRELVASIRAHGVLTPLLVRRVDKPTQRDGTSNWEVLCGSRRLGAAESAGLKEVPAIEFEGDDQAAAQVALLDNLQRAELHPLDEAAQFGRLIGDLDMTVEDVATKIGKSMKYVLSRVALGKLNAKGKGLMREGKLSLGVALEVARVDNQGDQLQVLEMLEKCVAMPSASQVRRWILDNLMLQLAVAPWPLKDAKLAGRPACANCPLRTSAEPELFDDLAGDDRCTDPTCWEAKQAAWTERAVTKQRKAGGKVVDDPEVTKEMFNARGELKDWTDEGEKYMDLDATPMGHGGPETLRALITDKMPAVTVAVDGQKRAHYLVDRAEATAALKACGVPGWADNPDEYDADERKQKQAEREAKLLEERKAVNARGAELVRIGAPMLEEDFWPTFAVAVLHKHQRDRLANVIDAPAGDLPLIIQTLAGLEAEERQAKLLEALATDGRGEWNEWELENLEKVFGGEKEG